ncbi:MAG: DUF1800 family protein [Pseudomonadota bacterium]
MRWTLIDTPTPWTLSKTAPPSGIRSGFLATTIACALTIVGCDSGGSRGATTPATGALTSNVLQTQADVSRFMARAGFGATTTDLNTWQAQDAAAWLQLEMAKPIEPLLPAALNEAAQQANGRVPFGDYNNYHLKRSLIESQAALRTKMTYALSHMLVVGGDNIVEPSTAFSGLAYHDALNLHAFGNYRDLLTAITYSPAMADWLTYLRNEPGDPASGREPDENYARELMQLFTIGLHELNLDGTAKRDGNGQLIPTYTNQDVAQLARVFTGFSHDSHSYKVWGDDRYAARARPLRIYADHHSGRPKSFLGTYIPAGVSGDDSVRMALDALFNHANVAPFVSRQLIQKFTTSDPSPDYVYRVATAFERGQFKSSGGFVFGLGARGDLAATVAAILLDPIVFDRDASGVNSAKVRDPYLQYLNFMRTFRVRNLEFITRANRIGHLDNSDSLGMAYFQSPSVFNFYRPGYVPPGTRSGDLGQTVPEFQAVQGTNLVGYTELMTDLILGRINTWSCPTQPGSTYTGIHPCNNANPDPQFAPDFSAEIEISDSPTQLTNHLDTLLTGGRMTPRVRTRIVEAVGTIPIDPNTRQEDLTKRVQVAVLMAVTAPSFAVIW